MNCQVNQKELEQQAKNEIHLDKYIKEQINQYTNVYRSKKQKVNLLLLNNFDNQFQILQNFSLLHPYSMSSVKSQFSSVILKEHEDKEVTSLSELQETLEKLQSQKSQGPLWKSIENKKFRIRADLEAIEFTELKDIVKFFDPKSGKIFDFKDLEEALKIEDCQVMLFNVFQAADDSMQEETIQLYLQTMD